MPTPDWLEWHRPYDVPDSALRRRLQLVQAEIRATLDRSPEGPLRAISLCAGQGRDLLGALSGHPRRADVRARLVELDPRNVELARRAAADAGFGGVEVVADDAARTDAYRGAVPAELVLVCGVFGNISDADIARTVAYLPHLCAPAATVIWTRHRLEPDRTPTIRGWFEQAGFEELTFHAPARTHVSVGVHRLAADPLPLVGGTHLFRFLR
jgi:hypothetical protein